MQSFLRGEEKAFDQLFRNYYPSLTLFAFKLIDNLREAEDIVQDCFVSLWERRHELDHINSIKSYLYTSIRYRCSNYLKKHGFKSREKPMLPIEMEDKSVDIETAMMMAELATAVYGLLDLLPPRMKEVVKMYYLEEKTYQEIGALLETEPETVRNQRFKALQFIRKTIIPD